MRSRILAVLLSIMPTIGFAQWSGPLNTARDLQSRLSDFEEEVRYAADESRRREGDRAYRQYQEIARAARQFGRNFDSGFMRDLRRGDIRDAHRQYDASLRDLGKLNDAVRSVRRLPWDLRNLHDDIVQTFHRLGTQLGHRPGGHGGGHGGGHDGGHGGGHDGGHAHFTGDCHVVLETLWGSNIQEFFGHSHASSANAAVMAARQDAIRQCQAHMRPLMKCTIVPHECTATRSH